MKTAFCLTAVSLVLAAPAFASKIPHPCGRDARVRCADYDPGQIWEIWTAPGGVLVIQFAENESVPEGNVAATDGSRLERKPRGNFLYLKSKAKEGETPCMVPEPLLVTTKLPDGSLRPYSFQIQTKPSDCRETPVAQAAPKTASGITLATAAETPTLPPRIGNLKYVKEGGLAEGSDVMYSVKFTYSRDEAAARAAIARRRALEMEKQQAHFALKQQVSWPYGNQFDGSWNFKYAAHGSMIPPAQIRDNGYQTVFLLPQMQRTPALFRLQPGATRCNREHDDHNEATVNPSVHRSGADGDTIIAEGTAQGWCLRDGNTVLEVLNLAYNPNGATPATGTVSPYVKRTLRDEPEEDPVAPPIPLQPQPQVQPSTQPRQTEQQQPTPLKVQPVSATGDQTDGR